MVLIEKVESYFRMLEAGMVDEALKRIKKLYEHPQMTDEIKFEIAEQFYQYGFLDEAIEVTNGLLAFYPDEAELILFMAELLIEGNQEDEALAILVDIASNEGDVYVRAVLLSADLYLMQGLYEVAEYKIRQALENYPEEKILHSSLGEVFYIQEKYQLAIISYHKGSEVSTYAKLADCYAHLGMFEEALSYYEKAATTESSTNTDLLFGYGFVAAQLEKWELASEKLSRVIEMDPYYTSVYPLLVNTYVKLKDTKKALDFLEMGLTYDQTNPYLFYLKAEILLEEQKAVEAQQLLMMALEVDDSYIPVLETLVEVSQKEEDWEQSLQYLKRLVEIVPERQDIYSKMGLIHEELENWTDAENCYRQSILLDEEDYETANRLAFLLRDEGKIQEAVSFWKKSLQLNPDQWDIEEIVRQYEEA